MSNSFRAGGIHWAATMDAGGFVAGARQVKAEATRLQRELKAIAAQDLDIDSFMSMTNRAIDNDKARSAEIDRFHKQTANNLNQAIAGMARYETFASKAISTNQKQAMSFRELNNSLKSAFGRGSDFKEFLELVSGAGAIAGIGLIAHSVEKMGSAFKQAAKDMATGAKTWEQSVDSVLRSIPILGSIGGGLADFALGLSPASFGGTARASHAEDMANAEIANAANRRFGEMIENLRNAGISRRSNGGIELRARQQLRELNELSAAGGVGPRQFLEGQRLIEEERQRMLKDLRSEELAARIDDLFQTKANTVSHWLKKMQADVEAFNDRTDKRLEAATDRWADRIRTKSNTFMHAFRELQKQQDAFNKERDRKRNAQDEFIGGARGFFDRLKEIERAEVRFGSGVVAGSQEDFANRQRAIFNPTIFRQNEKELARKAVKLQEEQLKENKEVVRLLRDTAKKLGVTDFN